MYLRKAITLQINSCLGPPSNDLHKLSDTQSILMYHSVVKVKKIPFLNFSKLSLKGASAYMLPQSSDICLQKVVIC